MPQKHYTPPLSRFIVCALYHEAKQRRIPMTQLANDLIEAGVEGDPGVEGGPGATGSDADGGGVNRIPDRSNVSRNHIAKSPALIGWALPFSASTHQRKQRKDKHIMITLECNYSKKLGLPGYSSHQFAITLRTEIADLNQVQAESARLYKLLQEGVDTSIKETGYLPTNAATAMVNAAVTAATATATVKPKPRMVPGTAPANRKTSSSRSSRSTNWRRPRSRDWPRIALARPSRPSTNSKHPASLKNCWR